MGQRIDGVEIFSTGKHHGSETVEIKESDLDEMINSFRVLGHRDGFRPVLKLGHDDAQAFFGSRKGSPNLGFVEKIWKQGSKILANFVNVPDALVDLIKNRRYNSVSIEMFPKTEIDGTKFSNVLTAVALLGAELPAVKGLKELAATLFTEELDPEFPGDVLKITYSEEDMPYTQEQVDGLIEAAVKKAEDKVRADFAADKIELESKVTSAEKERDDAIKSRDDAQGALLKYEQDTHTAHVTAVVEKAVKEGRILPAQKDETLAFALSLKGTVKFGDKEKSATSMLEDFINHLPKKVDFDEHGASDDPEKDRSLNAAQEVDARAKKIVKDSGGKTTYADARREVLDANPTLKQRYFEMGE